MCAYVKYINIYIFYVKENIKVMHIGFVLLFMLCICSRDANLSLSCVHFRIQAYMSCLEDR